MMTRQEIWNLIDRRQAELLQLCSDMIRIPSVNPPGDVSEIVRYITRYLDAHSISSQIVGPREDRPNILARCSTATAMWCRWAMRAGGISRPFLGKSETASCWGGAPRT